MFKYSKVVGKGHISVIRLLAIESFLRNTSFFNSGTYCLNRLPLKSKSVRFLNLTISSIFSRALLTNRNEINS